MTNTNLSEPKRKEHDSVIESVRARLVVEGNNVRTNKYKFKSNPVNHTQPNGEKITYYPDIYTYDENFVTKIFEVETPESINDNEAKEQWVLYARGRAKFYLVVPKDKVDETKKLINKYKIQVEDIWTY